MRRECRERFPRHWSQMKPLISDPGMHPGTCVTHVPRCMSGSLISGGGENVPGIPGASATRNFTYLARGLLCNRTIVSNVIWKKKKNKSPSFHTTCKNRWAHDWSHDYSCHYTLDWTSRSIARTDIDNHTTCRGDPQLIIRLVMETYDWSHDQ